MTPDIRVIFQIAGIGILVAIFAAVLKQSGKDDFANWMTWVALVGVLIMVIGYVDHLYGEIEKVFFTM